jgi:integrase
MAVLAECPTCHAKQKVKNKFCKCGEDLDKAKRSKRVRYWINYVASGKQRREPVGFSIEEAKTADGKRRAQKYENPRILVKVPEERMTFQQLTDWFLSQESVKKLAYFPTLTINLRSFNEVFGNHLVSNIKSADIQNYQAKRKNEGYSDAYVDHQTGAAKAVVNKAFDNDMVSGETVRTFKRVKKLLKRNSNARDRILTLDEFRTLLAHAAPHVRWVLAAGFYTGMRRGEILGLTWGKVDMEKRIIKLEAVDTKDKEPRKIPIVQELYGILKQIPKALHDNHVFLYMGKPIASIKTGLIRACKDAKLDYGRFVKGGFILHDLRHCFNTYMRNAGVAESVIMEITGHSTRTMFDRYNRIDDDDTHQAVDQLGRFLRNLDQNVDQKQI